MTIDFPWPGPFGTDVAFGYLDRSVSAPRHLNPQVVLNTEDHSMLRALREELRHCQGFTFSVAFVSPRAIALLKQELVEFAARGSGSGQIITSDYLGFNAPAAFSELLNLNQLEIDARLHREHAFHPKGYIFEYEDHLTAILGSSNLTENALVKNHEWNLRVTASRDSDLGDQLTRLIRGQLADSVTLSENWIEAYAAEYTNTPRPSRRIPLPPPPPLAIEPAPGDESSATLQPDIESAEKVAPPTGSGDQPMTDAHPSPAITSGSTASPAPAPAVAPNKMQQDALIAIDALRKSGKRKGVVISATGTGKTILSALDVRAYAPRRMLFVVHREQILDRAISEFQRVLQAPATYFGKLTGSHKQHDRRFVFATIQTLSREDVLSTLPPDTFDYVLIDEVHRAGAGSYKRVIDHFRPRFLLGMTATPERTDGFNIYELFDFNVPYEIRLNRALESDMLAPFHYYGISDVTFADGTTTSDVSEIERLASRVRVDHILNALSLYGQAGIRPRGLIFCSRKDEAHALSGLLNQRTLHGRTLRTVALTGDDSIQRREQVVQELEAGHLDYVLTVDIFNEGVDIPSVNQVVMLRQTQSSIVFVQQLGRGLRLHPDKEYVVVIDFIGNYANNYLIPIALFGDDSLNKESIKKNLIAAEETGVLAGLSSVRFDRVSLERVMRSIANTRLDSFQKLKSAIEVLRNRLGRIPTLHDFLRFESVDPVVLSTRSGSYPHLIEKLFKHDFGLSESERSALILLSNEALAARRPHELLTLRVLLRSTDVTLADLISEFRAFGAAATPAHVASALRTLTLEFHTEAERAKYVNPVVSVDGDRACLTKDFATSYSASQQFAAAVDDIIATGLDLMRERYDLTVPFTSGRQYTRKDACRLLCWEKNVSSTIYGYKSHVATGTCPIFVTYHKSGEISASTAYKDELLDRSTMLWYTRSNRTLRSGEVAAIVEQRVTPFVFVKKDDAEDKEFYFLGRATPAEAEQTLMPDDKGKQLNVVRMELRFDAPIDAAVFDYFHPAIIE